MHDDDFSKQYTYFFYLYLCSLNDLVDVTIHTTMLTWPFFNNLVVETQHILILHHNVSYMYNII